MTEEVLSPDVPRKAALVSRLVEIRTLFPGSTQHDAAPLRLALMSILRYVNDEDVTREVLALCPSLVLEEVR